MRQSDTVSSSDIHSSFVRRYSAPPLHQAAPVTFEAVNGVEAELGTSFPEAYRTFIVTHGPVFTPGVADTLGECTAGVAPEEEVFAVQEFLTPEQIVRDYRVCISGGMPDFLIPFAVDLGGHLFGFRKEPMQPRRADAPVLVFDHDYGKVRVAAESFDRWLAYFLAPKNGA